MGRPLDTQGSIINRNFSKQEYDECAVWGNKIALQMKARNLQGAVDMVQQGFLAMQSAECDTDLLTTPLVAMCNERHCNALGTYQIGTIGDLLSTTVSQLLTVPNFKELSVIDVMKNVLGYTVKRCIKLEHELSDRKGL